MASKKEINSKLKKAFSDWREAYKKYADTDYAAAIDQMKMNGQRGMLPEAGRILTDKSRFNFLGDTGKYKEECINALSEYKNEIFKQRTAAPSEEAIRVLEALKVAGAPNDMDAHKPAATAKMNELLKAYGDNYIFYSALKKIAGDWGLSLSGEHPADTAKANYEGMVNAINNTFNGQKAVHEGITDTEEKIFSVYVDGYMKPEE